MAGCEDASRDPMNGQHHQPESSSTGSTGERRKWLIRYSEIFLKSDWVRRAWVRRLVETIRQRMPTARVRVERGRIWLEGGVDSDTLKYIFGIVTFSEVEHIALEELEQYIPDFCRRRGFGMSSSFAIRVKRVGTHPFSSAEIASKYGDLLRREFPHLKVDLKSPEKTLYIEIRGSDVYLYDRVERGAGGIPPGVEGTVAVLLSGGIDSAVAAYMMMKRGCRIAPLCILMPPFIGRGHLSKVEEILKVLRRYQPDMELEVIEDEYLAKARERLERQHLEKYTCIFCKRRMYRLACSHASRIGAKGIVTGESLGQVASQTLDNLFVLDEAATMPVYRPLIGMDKEEIIALAREIGTFSISTSMVSECRAAPRKPSTSASIERIREIEAGLEIPGDPQGAVDRAEETAKDENSS